MSRESRWRIFGWMNDRFFARLGRNLNQVQVRSRCTVVTGGASGIGWAIAQSLARSGDQVVLWDLVADVSERAKELSPSSAGLPAVGVTCDVTSPESVAAAMQATEASLDGAAVTGLVCSAGITGPNMTVADYPHDAWKQVFEVNVHGLMLCNQAVVRHLLAKNGNDAFGRIVNIASVAGKEGNPNASAYSASKAAVIGLTKSLGKELAKTGIRVNCVTPAAVKTPMFDQMTQQHIDFMLSKIPMGRFGEVDEIASMVKFLLSDGCSFTTGAVFDCSGGRATY